MLLQMSHNADAAGVMPKTPKESSRRRRRSQAEDAAGVKSKTMR